MLTTLQQEIENVLKEFPNYWDNDVLLKNVLIEDIRNYKPEILSALLKNLTIKKTYSLDINGLHIFKVEEFISMLQYKNYLENSFTKYSNEVGLTSEGKYLKYNSDVILDFPHKDGVLEGGMTSEDLGKEEVYYHNVLSKEEIDTLLSPKLFNNIKKHNENGFQEINEINFNDNLIIKGNNLIALHTLKERYASKVKLIFIDPPYNTKKNHFGYNDRFNHSSWLTFMKNRLEIAKELLSPDGSIWISIDSTELHYLKVLADSIFGRENFVDEIIWQRAYAPVNLKKTFSKSHDSILVYSKNFDKNFEFNKLPRSEEANNKYKNPDNDSRGPWKPENFSVGPAVDRNIYKIITPSGRVALPPSGRSWVVSEERYAELNADNRVWFGENGSNIPSRKNFLSEVRNGIIAQTLWTHQEAGHNQDGKKELIKLFKKDIFATPKPEKLLHRIIHIGSDENDIVLDFFMGSATTQAVSMKMNRQFIGIEQMDYINTVSVPRLKKVIEGEQGGISKEVEWQGGGSFVYAELFELNQVYINELQNTVKAEEIENIINKIKTSPFLNIKVDVEKLLSKKEVFFELSLKEQKELLIQVLDNNQLYLSYSEIDDDQYAIDDQTKAFNRSFYQEEV